MTKSPDCFSWKMRLLLFLILTVCTFEFSLSCPRHTVVPATFFQVVTKLCVFCLQERQRHWCCNSTQCIQAALGFPHRFAPRRIVFISRSTSVDDQGQSVRNCDCGKISTAISTRLPGIHPAQRSVSTRQQCTFMPRDSGILLTDFGCSYPSVNHGWIIRYLIRHAFLDFFKDSSILFTTIPSLLSSTLAKCEVTLRWKGTLGRDALLAGSLSRWHSTRFSGG